MKNAKRDGEIRQGAMAAAVTDRLIASSYLERAEDLLAKQRGRTVDDNRSSVARTLRISVSTVANIRRARRKVVPGWLKEKIVRLFIQAAQAELMAIENEIEVARQIGLGNGDDALIAARARATALLAVLDGVGSEGSAERAGGGR